MTYTPDSIDNILHPVKDAFFNWAKKQMTSLFLSESRKLKNAPGVCTHCHEQVTICRSKPNDDEVICPCCGHKLITSSYRNSSQYGATFLYLDFTKEKLPIIRVFKGWYNKDGDVFFREVHRSVILHKTATKLEAKNYYQSFWPDHRANNPEATWHHGKRSNIGFSYYYSFMTDLEGLIYPPCLTKIKRDSRWQTLATKLAQEKSEKHDAELLADQFLNPLLSNDTWFKYYGKNPTKAAQRQFKKLQPLDPGILYKTGVYLDQIDSSFMVLRYIDQTELARITVSLKSGEPKLGFYLKYGLNQWHKVNKTELSIISYSKECHNLQPFFSNQKVNVLGARFGNNSTIKQTTLSYLFQHIGSMSYGTISRLTEHWNKIVLYEIFHKAGFNTLAAELIESITYHNSWKEDFYIHFNQQAGKKLHHKLGISKPVLQLLKTIDQHSQTERRSDMRRIIYAVQHLNEYPILASFDSIEARQLYLLKMVLKSYIQIHLAIKDFDDHLSVCYKLKKSGKSIKPSELFPNDFADKHADLATEVAVLTDQYKDLFFTENYPLWIRHLGCKGERYFIDFPKNRSDLIKEGKKLHHCVGGYIDKVINHKCVIGFLRNYDNPDKPLYTFEINNNQSIQIRGLQNSNPDSEALEFFNTWKETYLFKLPDEFGNYYEKLADQTIHIPSHLELVPQYV